MPDHIKPLPDPEPQKPRRRWPLYLLAVLIVLALLAAFLLTKTHVLDGLKRSLRYLGKNGENYGSVSFETLGSTAYGHRKQRDPVFRGGQAARLRAACHDRSRHLHRAGPPAVL